MPFIHGRDKRRGHIRRIPKNRDKQGQTREQGQTDRQTDRQTDIQTTDRQTDRQTDRTDGDRLRHMAAD